MELNLFLNEISKSHIHPSIHGIESFLNEIHNLTSIL